MEKLGQVGAHGVLNLFQGKGAGSGALGVKILELQDKEKNTHGRARDKGFYRQFMCPKGDWSRHYGFTAADMKVRT